MFRGRSNVACLIALAASLAWTSGASAVVVASLAGPTVFDGIGNTVVLPNVSIGLEGTVSLEFKADDTAGMHELWYCADKPAPVPAPWASTGSTLPTTRCGLNYGRAGCSAGFECPLNSRTRPIGTP